MKDHRQQPRWRLGAVSFLNAKPLIAGLDADPQIELIYEVPARLPAMLERGTVDVALVPVVDLFQEGRAWQIAAAALNSGVGAYFTILAAGALIAYYLTKRGAESAEVPPA